MCIYLSTFSIYVIYYILFYYIPSINVLSLL